MDCQNFFYQIKNNKKHTIKNKKPKKTEEELGTTYCLGCKDFTHNFRPQRPQATVLREKLNCVVH